MNYTTAIAKDLKARLTSRFAAMGLQTDTEEDALHVGEGEASYEGLLSAAWQASLGYDLGVLDEATAATILHLYRLVDQSASHSPIWFAKNRPHTSPLRHTPETERDFRRFVSLDMEWITDSHVQFLAGAINSHRSLDIPNVIHVTQANESSGIRLSEQESRAVCRLVQQFPEDVERLVVLASEINEFATNANTRPARLAAMARFFEIRRALAVLTDSGVQEVLTEMTRIHRNGLEPI